MLKKIFLSICAIAVIAYLSLWAWAVHWIDEDKNIVDFVSEDKNMTLETAKFIWKITPAINREKDAQRLLKMAELSVYTDLTHNITMLKNNYNTISQYHKKYENKLNEQLKSRFILQKLIFMNRSLKKIEDKEFEKEISNTIENKSFYGADNLETRLEWLPEIIWFLFNHKYANYYNENIFTNYVSYFKYDLMLMNKKYNNQTFDNVFLYHKATLFCYLKNEANDDYKKEELDKNSMNIFKTIQKNITSTSNEIELLNNLLEKNSNFLLIFPIVLSAETECEKEAKNFLSKINETYFR